PRPSSPTMDEESAEAIVVSMTKGRIEPTRSSLYGLTGCYTTATRREATGSVRGSGADGVPRCIRFGRTPARGRRGVVGIGGDHAATSLDSGPDGRGGRAVHPPVGDGG